jgi:hypothetical protein
MLAEGGRRPDQGVGPLDFQFRREPRPSQHAEFSPIRRGQVVLRGEMLSQRRQQRVPSLVADGDGSSRSSEDPRHLTWGRWRQKMPVGDPML